MSRVKSQNLTPHRDTLHHSVAALVDHGEQYFLPEALELLRQTKNDMRLNDDVILLLVISAMQALRAYSVEHDAPPPEQILAAMVDILDHEEVIMAEYNKLYEIFRTAHIAFPKDHQ